MSKPVCKIAVLAFDVPSPTSDLASMRAIEILCLDNSRAIAVPTTPAPMTATS